MTAFVADIFGRSPVVPLENHVDIAYRCAHELAAFFEAALAENWDEAQRSGDAIVGLEHEADKLKKEIRLHLSRSLFMPVARTDLLALLIEQDRMANRAKDVSRLVLGRKMQVPAEIAGKLTEFIACSIDTARQARECVCELSELVTVGFRGSEVCRVESMIEHIEEMETETDKLQVALRAALYEVESELKPVNAIFLYQVIELIGEIANAANRVGHRLQLLLSH